MVEVFVHYPGVHTRDKKTSSMAKQIDLVKFCVSVGSHLPAERTNIILKPIGMTKENWTCFRATQWLLLQYRCDLLCLAKYAVASWERYGAEKNLVTSTPIHIATGK